MEFKRLEMGNYCMMIGPDSWVSYNPMPQIGGIGPETALAFPDKENGGTIFLILDGDWRKAYQKAAEADGFGGCLKVWNDNKAKYRNGWTSTSDPTD